MARKTKDILQNVTAAQLKGMLKAKERIDELEAARKQLAADLAKVDKEIQKLLGGAAPAPRKKAAKGKGAAKRGRPKASSKKKVVAKKAGKKAVGKSAGKAPRKKAGTGARLEDVVIQVIKAGGKKMSYPEIRDTIVSKKLYASKSKNFDNVLRRTISTAKKIKRVGRGVYAV